jgi:hypothetical protein
LNTRAHQSYTPTRPGAPDDPTDDRHDR